MIFFSLQVISTLKQEIKLREELLKKAQSQLDTISTNNAGKVGGKTDSWSRLKKHIVWELYFDHRIHDFRSTNTWWRTWWLATSAPTLPRRKRSSKSSQLSWISTRYEYYIHFQKFKDVHVHVSFYISLRKTDKSPGWMAPPPTPGWTSSLPRRCRRLQRLNLELPGN